MEDLFVAPQGEPKSRRVCANAFCGRNLSSLNKQMICFGCYDKAQMRRFTDPDPKAVIPNGWRWKQH